MKPKRNRTRFTVVTASLLLAGFGAAACAETSDRIATPAASTTGTDTTPETTPAPRVVSATEGQAARDRFAPVGAGAAESSVAADEAIGSCGGVYVPTQEELDNANADADGLAAEFERFGVASTRSIDELGFVYIEYDYDDAVVASIADSYWAAKYPVEPPEPVPQAELDAVRADNDIIVAALEEAGVEVVRTTDEMGWESLEYDYEDPAAQAAVNAAWLIISPPEPPSAEVLADQTKYNDELMAAFDQAGISYELVSDELGWAWVEWDYEDTAVADQVSAVFDALYPPTLIDPSEQCLYDDTSVVSSEEPAVDPAAGDPAVDDPAVVEPVVEDRAVEEPAVVDGLTDEQIVARDGEIEALAGGFAAAGVAAEVIGESPWQTVVFDLTNDASGGVIAAVLTARG